MAGKPRKRIRICYAGGPGEITAELTRRLEALQRRIFKRVYCTVRKSHWWIAYDGEEPVAFCALYQYPDDPSVVFLALCGVLPSHRGLGLQRKLIRVRIEKARRLGAKRAITYTATDKAQSANNLFDTGFRVYVPKWTWGLEHAIYFQLKL